jgi:hypothetical protein
MKKQVLVFCFFVMVTASLMAQDVIDREVQKAVNGLASKILSPLKVNIKDVTQAGTKDMTSELSVYLYSIIKHYAVNTPMLNVVDLTRGPKDPNEPSIGIISGTYNIKGKAVEIILELMVDERVRSSQRFSIPVSEIEKMDISMIPENYNNQNEAVKQDKTIATITEIIKPSKNKKTQFIQIQAWFDSQLGSRVFMHRESLNLTVMADNDCYFKVIHIDVNNQMKMIYPNSDDTDNHLVANTPRSILETNKFYFYAPYGAETILFIASANQFENIESDYISPWTVLTPQNIRTAIRGSRGLEFEEEKNSIENLVKGEARYTITILKPNEEYEYGRPDNMSTTIQAMRNDAIQQGGTFEGNETSGFSVIENVRVSYRIPRDKPDTIQFAIYNLDNLSRGRRSVARKGAGHTFSFEKPENITQTIQMVRIGIEDKGGSFRGNEQQGNFKASGIEGQYIVSEKVNVTITDKPVLVPNSLIEKEVKNYFGRSE